MFGGAFSAAARDAVAPAPGEPRWREMAARLPAGLRMGTSSWSFPGWEGIVWADKVESPKLARRGLEAYGQHPLLRTVGLDRTFYGPMDAVALGRYARQVPDGFEFLVKAYEGCTTFRFPDHPRYGDRRRSQNPDYLDPGFATEEVVAPFVEGLGDRAGVLLFQFPPQDPSRLGGPRYFPDRLHRFLRALPVGPRYAVEIRNPELLTPRYAAALADVGATHGLVAHPTMPDLREQRRIAAPAVGDTLVVRWMLHRGLDYQGAKNRYAPFDRLVDEDPGTRARVVDLLGDRIPRTYLIVNNKAEGSSPLSILRVAEALVDRLGGVGQTGPGEDRS